MLSIPADSPPPISRAAPRKSPAGIFSRSTPRPCLDSSRMTTGRSPVRCHLGAREDIELEEGSAGSATSEDVKLGSSSLSCDDPSVSSTSWPQHLGDVVATCQNFFYRTRHLAEAIEGGVEVRGRGSALVAARKGCRSRASARVQWSAASPTHLRASRTTPPLGSCSPPRLDETTIGPSCPGCSGRVLLGAPRLRRR